MKRQSNSSPGITFAHERRKEEEEEREREKELFSEKNQDRKYEDGDGSLSCRLANASGVGINDMVDAESLSMNANVFISGPSTPVAS